MASYKIADTTARDAEPSHAGTSGESVLEARYEALGYSLSPEELARVGHGFAALSVRKEVLLDEDLLWQHPPGRHLIREAVGLDRDAVFRDFYRKLEQAP